MSFDTGLESNDILKVVSDTVSSQVIVEGKAEILIPSSNNVFYNPVQEFNRDLSVAVLTLCAEDHYKKVSEKRENAKSSAIVEKDRTDAEPLAAGNKCEVGLIILEALSATGLRSIRYAKEICGIKQIIANDISENAVNSIRDNIAHNGVASLITTSHKDATLMMYEHRHPTKRFHAVDLDPYGCPSQFLDAAVQCITDGGLLLVTCTDMAVLAGNSPETCYTKYGAVSLRNRACHEMALRIVLQCIEAHANRYGRYIVPLLSISADFYVRVFVKIFTGPAVCKRTTSKLSMVYQCTGCETLSFQPLGVSKQYGEKPNQFKFSLPHGPPVGTTCEHCSHKYHIGGPIWSGLLHDKEFVSRLEQLVENSEYGTCRRMQGVLAVVQEELPDVPLYYTLEKLCSTIRAETMSMIQFRSALMNAGFRVSFSHANRYSIKTNAPAYVVWDVLRAWERKHPVRHDRLTGAAAVILSKASTTEISFEIHPDANPGSRQKGLVRFQENPQRFWGPGTRAKTSFQGEEMKKSKKNQGKRCRSESASPSNERNQKHPLVEKIVQVE